MTPARVINDHYVLQTPDAGQYRALFPDLKVATVQGKQFVAVPQTLEAARVLNNLGVKVQSPIRTNYSWPGRFTPRWYQIDTSEFFTLHTRAHCHSAPRTGKTNAALWAADYLRKEGYVHRVLIVAPLSTLFDVWERAIFESLPLNTFAVLHGSRQKRHDLLAQKCDYSIINHHGVGLIEEALSHRPDIDLVIVDEVAVFRNSRSKTLFKPLNRVLNAQKIVRAAWGLTGTPTPNDATDAFGQCKLLTPENYHGHFTAFKQETMLQFGPFKWVPKKGSEKSVARILKPSIRFERSVCTDMEPCFIERRAEMSEDQKKAYKQLIAQAATEVRGSTVTAVNAAVLISKLVQTACLSSDTEVLCQRGWTPLIQVTRGDLVWDGVEWVTSEGCIYRGERSVIEVGSIKMTSDHKILTTTGWVQAGEMYGKASEELTWADVRIPRSYSERGDGRERRGDMALSLPMRKGDSTRRKSSSRLSKNSPEKLRMPFRRNSWKASPKLHSPVQTMDCYPDTMPERKKYGVSILWRKRHICVRPMGRLIRELRRRHGADVQTKFDVGQGRQQRPVLPRELSLGFQKSPTEQYSMEPGGGYTGGANADYESKRKVRHFFGDDSITIDPRVAYGRRIYASRTEGDKARPVARHSKRAHDHGTGSEFVRASSTVTVGAIGQRSTSGDSTDHQTAAGDKVSVYDLINCGPRSRFVVRGSDRVPRIVHNCGVVIAADGSLVKFDFGPRMSVLEEVIAENDEKVIVLVPFTGALDAVATELRKRWSVAVVDGRVSAGARTTIFREFRTLPNPHVLVAHPQVLAHGLDLTAATLTIWYAPTYKAEVYQQANARMDGSKQKIKIDICHLYATAEEKKIYQVLKDKGKLQEVVLSLSNIKM